MEDERWDRYRRPGGRPWAGDMAPEGARSLADWVERLLLQIAILGLVALVLVQALLTQPALRKWAVLADRLEGVNWAELLPHRAAAMEARTQVPPGTAGQAPAGTPQPGNPGQGNPGQTVPGGTSPGSPVPSSPGGASPGSEIQAAPPAARPGSQPSADPAGQGKAPALAGPQTGAAPPAGATPDAAVPVGGQAASGEVTVMLMTRRSAPGARLLVDGQPAGDFRNGAVTVRVVHGQRISVDGQAVKDPLTFRVVASGWRTPPLGAEVTTQGNQQPLGVAAR